MPPSSSCGNVHVYIHIHFYRQKHSNIMDVTVAEMMPKSTTKDDKINFQIHKVVDTTEKIQHSEEEERHISFFIAALTNYHKLGLKQKLLSHRSIDTDVGGLGSVLSLGSHKD